MSKQDLFVVIYTCIWASVIIVCYTFNKWHFHLLDDNSFVLLSNFLFLSFTSLFVFIKPIRKWVNINIIDKLP